MLSSDGMHAFDLGALIRLIIAILLKYFYCAEEEIGMEGLAASRMEARMRMYLARMMMHSLRKEAAALLCEGVQSNLIHILHI
jgi:hypothetical protein